MKIDLPIRELLLCAVALAGAGCAAHEACRTSPQLSLVVAQGDRESDWQLAADAASSQAPRRIWGDPLMVPNQNQIGDETFYGDDVQSGQPAPVDASSMLLYIGHGLAEQIQADGSWLYMDDVQLGDNLAAPGPRGMRYAWFCSCQTFAHGPSVPSTNLMNLLDYPWPGKYDPIDPTGDEDSSVYATVLPSMGKNLRLACGSSTYATCSPDDLSEIWNDFRHAGFDVADSFLDGLLDDDSRVPLCLATGGGRPDDSALYDRRFRSEANDTPQDHVHLEYVQEFAANEHRRLADPGLDRVLTALHADLGLALGQLQEQRNQAAAAVPPKARPPAPATPWAGRDCLPLRPGQEGVVYCPHLGHLGIPEPLRDKPSLDEKTFLDSAKAFVKQHNWCTVGQTCQAPHGYRLLIDTVTTTAAKTPVYDWQPGQWQPQVTHYQKGVLVTFKRLFLSADGSPGTPPFDVVELGRDGTIVLELDNQARVIHAARRWSLIQPQPSPENFRSLADAREAAMLKAASLHLDMNLYQEATETLGYQRESTGASAQLKYIFYFVPNPDKDKEHEHYPQTITVPLDAAAPP